MKTIEDARILARTMVDIGDSLGRDTRAILTDMDQPLGRAVGNNLEVKEAIATLNGHGPADFQELCLSAGAIMLLQAKATKSIEEGRALLLSKIKDGSGLKKLAALVKAQGGDESYIYHPEKFPVAQFHAEVLSDSDGYVRQIDALEIGESAMRLGAGRATKDDIIDMSAGIIVDKKVGEAVKKGEKLCDVYTNIINHKEILDDVRKSFKLSATPVKLNPIVHETIE